ncbi:MAG: carboxypeptidase-like regulatory domain-containing protein, partial [Halarsenatibacteraceae bacterium]
MRFKRLKIAGLVALALVLMVAIGACDSASPIGSGSNGELAEEHDVTVLVVDDGDQALEGVRVILGDSVEETDHNGTAEFAGVEAGSYQLDVDYDGYNAWDGEVGTVTVEEELTDFTVEMAVDGDSGDSGGDDGSGDSQDDGEDDGSSDDGDTSGDDGSSDDDDVGGDDGSSDDDSDIDDGGSDGDDSDDGDTEGDDGSSDGDDSGDDTGGGTDPVDGGYNQSGVLSVQFDSSENKVVDLGKLAVGETAIVAVSPLNIDPNNANTYDASLNVTYSDGTTASQTEVESLDTLDSEEAESSPQAELDAELRELENELLAQDLEPAGAESGTVTVQDTYQVGDSRSFY